MRQHGKDVVFPAGQGGIGIWIGGIFNSPGEIPSRHVVHKPVVVVRAGDAVLFGAAGAS